MKTLFLVPTALALTLIDTLGLAAAETNSQSNQQSEQAIERVTISSRISTAMRELTTSVSVLSAEQIQSSGYVSLVDLLSTQPAVNVSSNGGVGSTTTLRLRGEEGYRTLVRIDGVDIADPTGPQVQPQLAHLLSNNISRVEILRGTQGLMYGADAGGVIEISTDREQSAKLASLSAEIGGKASRNLAVDIGSEFARFDYAFSASQFSTDGFNARRDDTQVADDDGYDNTTLHGRVGAYLSEEVKLDLVVRHTKGETEFDSCGFADTIRAQFYYNGKLGEQRLAYTHTDVDRQDLNQNTPGFSAQGEVERFEYLGNNQLTQSWHFSYGFDWEKESIKDANSRTQQGYFAELQHNSANGILATLGARLDDNDDFGEHISYRLSAAKIWDVAKGEIKLRGAYGTGFRAPSLFEISYNQGPFSFPPASETALREEKSQGYEFAIHYDSNQGSRLELVYFDQQIEDSLFFDLNSFSGYLQDEGKALSQGVELISSVKINDNVLVSANYTYNQTEDPEGNERLRRPTHLANLGLSYQNQSWQVNTQLRYVGGQLDVATELDAYWILDISTQYQLNPNLQLQACIENALDEAYQQIAGFNTAGVTAYLGVRYQMD
jgi:vitamin B12 transporter